MGIYSEVSHDALQGLINSVAINRPSVGKRVRIVSGRKHLGTEGLVAWHGLDKFSTAFRYASDAQALLRDAQGTWGFRVRIIADSGESFFVSADKVEIVP